MFDYYFFNLTKQSTLSTFKKGCTKEGLTGVKPRVLKKIDLFFLIS